MQAAAFRDCPRCGAPPASVYASSAYCRQCRRTYGRGRGEGVPAQTYPVRLYATGHQGYWLLSADLLPPGSGSLVRDDQAARRLAADQLSRHLQRSITPEQVQLLHREHPALTLARMDADPDLSLAELGDLATLPTPD